nr:hypothetical protein [Methylobacterium organophilum]
MIFSAPMVRALLEGRKTQTRRILKPQPPEWATFCQQPKMLNVEHRWVPSGLWRWSEPEQSPRRPLRQWPVDADGDHYWLQPAWSTGDRLWVRESIRAEDCHETWNHGVRYLADDAWAMVVSHNEVESDAFGRWWLLNGYRSDDPDLTGGQKVPSIHMPRWSSRLTLIVKGVKVERLQDISEEDAIAEGVQAIAGVDGATAIAPTPARHFGATPVDAFARLWEHINGVGSWDTNPWVVAIGFSVFRSNIDDTPVPDRTEQGGGR